MASFFGFYLICRAGTAAQKVLEGRRRGEQALLWRRDCERLLRASRLRRRHSCHGLEEASHAFRLAARLSVSTALRCVRRSPGCSWWRSCLGFPGALCGASMRLRALALWSDTLSRAWLSLHKAEAWVVSWPMGLGTPCFSK